MALDIEFSYRDADYLAHVTEDCDDGGLLYYVDWIANHEGEYIDFGRDLEEAAVEAADAECRRVEAAWRAEATVYAFSEDRA